MQLHPNFAATVSVETLPSYLLTSDSYPFVTCCLENHQTNPLSSFLTHCRLQTQIHSLHAAAIRLNWVQHVEWNKQLLSEHLPFEIVGANGKSATKHVNNLHRQIETARAGVKADPQICTSQKSGVVFRFKPRRYYAHMFPVQRLNSLAVIVFQRSLSSYHTNQVGQDIVVTRNAIIFIS